MKHKTKTRWSGQGGRGVRRLAASLLMAFLAWGYPASAAVPTEVEVTRPVRGDIFRYVTLPGTIRANQQITIYAKTAGYLRAILVDKGEAVPQGALLAEIEAPELWVERVRYLAELNKTKAELVKTKVDTAIAALEFERLSKAQKLATDLVTAQSVDNARARFEVAKAADGVAQANDEVAKANLERIETLLKYTRITAPFAGIITARFVDLGAFIPTATSGGAALNAAIVTLMDFDTVRVQVPVTELEAPLITKGQPVRVSVEGLPGRAPLEGSVSRLAYVLDEATRTMLVEADLPNPKHELRPGMYVTVKLGVDQHRAVTTVPVEGIVMEKSNAYIFLLVDGQAKKTPVKTGFNDGRKVELLSGTVMDAPVILVGKMVLTDGQSVKAVKAR